MLGKTDIIRTMSVRSIPDCQNIVLRQTDVIRRVTVACIRNR